MPWLVVNFIDVLMDEGEISLYCCGVKRDQEAH